MVAIYGGRMKRIVRYFFEGLIFVVPVAITIYVVYKAFVIVDSWLPLPWQGAGFLVILIGITIVGFLASNFLTRSVLRFLEALLNRLPFVKLLHSSVKDIMTAFVGEQKRFDRPVVVELIPGTGVMAIGFMTRESLEQFNLQNEVAVYFPQSYNFAGNLVLYPKGSVRPLNAESSKVMAFVVSGGVTY
jgi:uncharacterized membrane protein